MNLVPLFEEALEFQDYNGSVLSNGKAAVYYIGRTRLADIYNDVDAEYPAENPRILDNLGMGPVYVNPAFDYELVVFDAYNNELFSVKKYIHSKGEHSTANVVVTPSESIAVSAWTVGEVQVYMPYLTGDVGKVYTGIDPVNVDNVNDTISVSHVGLGLQEPLYFVEDSETACIIGCSAQAEIPSATSGKWEDAADTVIANSAQWAEGASYEAGSYVDITDNTISVTGLQPSGDYADSTALDTKLDTTAFSDVSGSFITAVNIPESANWNSTYETVSTNSAGWTSNPQIPVTGINGIKISESGNLVVFEVSADYATESFVNGAVDSAVSGKLDSATYAAQSGNFYLTSNPAGYITGVPSSYLQNSDLTIVDNKITEISGIELSAGDEFPQSATEAIEVVTANSGDWNTVTAKLDKADSGNFYPMDGNPSGFLTTETDWTNAITAASSYAYEQATAAIPAPFDPSYISGKVDDLSSDKLDATAFSTVSGSFLTAHQDLPESATWNTVTSKLDTTAFSTVSGDFLTAHQDLSDYQTIAGMTAYQEAGNYLTADALDNVSGTWNTVTNKLDTTAFSTVSGDFITAHQSLPQSANWNSTYNTVRDNSGSWTGGIEYTGIDPIVVNNTVHQISANTWSLSIGDGLSAVEDDVNRQTIISVTGGGTTYTGDAQGALDEVYSKSGDWNTVTNKLNTTAFSTVSGDFLTSLPQDLATTGDIQDLAESISETYQPKGDYYLASNPSGFITGVDLTPYQEKTGMTAYQSAGDYMTADALTGVSSTWNTVTGKLDSTAFSTVSGSFITSHQSLPESATWNTVTSKLDTTAFSTVSGDFLTAHQSLSESANWNSTYNTVSNNSASWATVTDKLDSTAFSTVSGSFITAYQELPESANWNAAYNEVSTNSADWNSAAGMNELPVSAGEGIDIQNVDGNIVFSCTGGSVPEGVLVESGLEYNAVNEISGYSGSAFAQYGAEKQWLQHDDTLLHVANSAQYALGVNVTALQRLMGIDETLLYSGELGAIGGNITINEPMSSFNKIGVFMAPAADNPAISYYPTETLAPSRLAFKLQWAYNYMQEAYIKLVPTGNNVTFKYDGNTLIQYKHNATGITTTINDTAYVLSSSKLRIIGIGRKEV